MPDFIRLIDNNNNNNNHNKHTHTHSMHAKRQAAVKGSRQKELRSLFGHFLVSSSGASVAFLVTFFARLLSPHSFCSSVKVNRKIRAWIHEHSNPKKAYTIRAATLQKCGSEFLIRFSLPKVSWNLAWNFGEIFRATFSRVWVCEGNFHQNFTSKTVWKTENFTQISLCWGAALIYHDISKSRYVQNCVQVKFQNEIFPLRWPTLLTIENYGINLQLHYVNNCSYFVLGGGVN